MPPKKRSGKGKTPSAAAATNTSGSDTTRISTGILISHPKAIDIHIDAFSLQYHGLQLIQDTTLELNYGRRYGLIGLNGSGKSTLMQCLGNREVPIPERFNIYFLDKEMEASDRTPVECVIEDVEAERQRLEEEADSLADDEDQIDALNIIYERIDELDPELARVRAAKILHGLGFTPEMQTMKSREFSGGWRMRISLAKALFIKPMLLLLDEPTNHLDVESCVWLEEYLKRYPHILVIVSHSQDFLNGVCTNIMHLNNHKLKYYGGNYDAFVRTREELEENQMKIYNREQADIQRMTDYIARFGHGSAKLARQAQSKEKVLQKMKDSGLTEKVVRDRTFAFRFNDPGTLPPPVLQFDQVSFGYPGKRLLYKSLDLGIDLDSRVALVGPNGVGKSTLLKLMVGDLVPVEGTIKRHSHLRFGRYHQHLTEEMDLDLSPCEYMLQKFPDVITKDSVRSAVGRFGITGELQLKPIRNLSDGQRSRLAFATIAYQNPHVLLLDEPTNHLDMETIDSLAEAINDFEGGLVLVSHDFRLITQVAEEIWVCDNTTVTRFGGGIQEYKEILRKRVEVDL